MLEAYQKLDKKATNDHGTSSNIAEDLGQSASEDCRKGKTVRNFSKHLQACVDKSGGHFKYSVWHILVPI